MRVPHVGTRRSHPQTPSSCELMNDELLEYEGPHGTRALCHLLIFLCAEKPPVCVVGNFDGGLGSSTTNAIQVVATRVAERIHRDDFRLIECYPHWSPSHHRYSEVTLTPAPATQLAYGQVLTGDPANPHTEEHTVVVRFVDPQWTPRSENGLAKLLGEEAVRELRSY